MPETVLVTGGAGYIGSHVCKALSRAGYLPVTYDDLSTGNDWSVRWGPFVRGDILDTGRLHRALLDHGVVAVAHLAARCLAGEGERAEPDYTRVNVEGTRSMLRAMRDAGVRRLVHSSTCAVYGQPPRVPVDEACPLAPVSVYGRTKLGAENAIRDAAAAGGLHAWILRYFNASGADPEGEIGELHDPETHLVPRVLDALAARTEIELFGSDYPTPDGSCVRDYLHVTDIAAAHVAALARVPPRDVVALNLGSGSGSSVREVIRACERITGLDATVRTRARRAGDPASLHADPSLARSLLGWSAAHADLDEIVSTAWRWHRHRSNVIAHALPDRGPDDGSPAT